MRSASGPAVASKALISDSEVMTYRIMYSRLGVVRDAGPFPDRQDAIKAACRLQRVMPGYRLEIWSGDECIMDHEAIKKRCNG
jgi:hypothetical protein